MPIHACTLPGGGKGFKWGGKGKCYANRADAEKQAQAAYAHGYAGDEALAMDKTSTRTKDADGRLHVELTPISKANVCPYYGREIPEAESLGLDPDKIYYLWRHPDELAKAASTFNKVQLLEEHQPVHAGDPKQTITVGALGESAVFEHPYLKNTLAVWDARAISGIETDEKKQLSSSYRYRADMTPGVTPEGVHFDGVMRDIVGNHVALVTVGRAGADVAVGDSQPEDLDMAGDAFKESDHPRDKTGKFGAGGGGSAGSAVAKPKGSAAEHLAASNKHEAEARNAKGNKKHRLLAKAHQAAHHYHTAMAEQSEGAKAEHHRELAGVAKKTAEHHASLVKNFKNDGTAKSRDSRAERHREDGKAIRHQSPGAADANTVENPMKNQGTKRLAMRVALGQYLRPALASDAAIPYDKLIAQDASPKKVAAAVKRHYAKTTEVDSTELANLLALAADEAEEEEKAEDEEEDDEDEEGAEDEEEDEEEREEHKRGADRRRGKDAKRAGDHKRGADRKRGKDVGPDGPEKRGEDRKAADAALVEKGRAAAMADFQAIREAEELVRPLVGALTAAAMDSAASIYRHALEARGHDLDGVPDAALPAMVKMELKNADSRPAPRIHAADAAAASTEFATKYPNAQRPGRV